MASPEGNPIFKIGEGVVSFLARPFRDYLDGLSAGREGKDLLNRPDLEVRDIPDLAGIVRRTQDSSLVLEIALRIKRIAMSTRLARLARLEIK